jgi:pimeloyl-ACP methyl ester carboxylesterase
MTDVVILPGLDGTGRLLAAFCARLRRSGIAAQAMVYPADVPMGYDALEAHVRAQLGARSPSAAPFVLLGESFSGPLALRIAVDPPPGLVGLALSTTFARSPVPALAPLASLLRFAPARPPVALLSWWLLGPWSTPALRDELSSALRAVAPEALRENVSARLPAVRMPVLHLVARRDRLLARAAAEVLARGLPQCTTVAVDGPHLLLQTAAEPCARALLAFVRGLREASGAVSEPSFDRA